MESLINFQMDLRSRIKKAVINWNKAPSRRTLSYVESRLEAVEQLWFEFLNVHKQIMLSVDSKVLKETEYYKEDIYDTTETEYLDYKCELKTYQHDFRDKTNDNKPNETNFNVIKQNHVRLPKINIPIFSGKYLEWATFKELFKTLIHNNVSLSSIEKLQYLKGYVSGEAELILRNLPIVDANYDRCWDALVERYENKKYVCHQILKKFLSQRNLTTESSNGLKDLIDTTSDCLATLANVGVNIDNWDILVIHILTLKLDPETRRQWEFNVTSKPCNDLPTFKQFREFITGRFRAIEFLEPRSSSSQKYQPVNSNQVSQNNQFNNNNRFKSMHTAVVVSCKFCSGDHKLGYCKDFAKESVESRRNFVQHNNVCFNCLGSNHTAKACQVNMKCKVCKRRHHYLLHPQTNSNVVISEVVEEAPRPCAANLCISSVDVSLKSDEEPKMSCYSVKSTCSQVLLATALVDAVSVNGKGYTIRALLDQGSQSSFVTESVVQYLGLRKIPISSEVSGIGGDKSLIIKAMVTLNIKSRINPGVNIAVKAYVLKAITNTLPARKLRVEDWKELYTLTLADPNYHTPNKIDLLLGAEVYADILQEGVKKGPNGGPIAQATSLGWILSGVVNRSFKSAPEIKVMHCSVSGDEMLKRFWEMESDVELPKEKLFTEDERRCEKYFNETTSRDSTGRYIVRIPFTTDKPGVTGSEQIAERRFRSQENKLNKNQGLKKQYVDVINEYVQMGHMELVPKEQIGNKGAVYLPHHAVLREDKDTTKCRVVFDASCKGRNGISLNQQMLIGPRLQPELRHIIMRWRSYPVCLSADIVKMYRQVRVHSQDIDFQRILWRGNLGSDIAHYRLTRVTFGTAAAPYLAVKALQQVALDESANHPLASEKVLNDFYVDDLMTGCQNVKEGIEIYRELNALLEKGGFELQKWSSNSNELMEIIKLKNDEDKINEEFKIKTDETIKIMGLTWNRSVDSFQYTVAVPTIDEPVTKRKIISDIAKFYDPLGWVAPSVILAKITIQKLWLAGISWDDPVPEALLSEWLTYREELKDITKVSVPRWVGRTATDKVVELHGFSDASKAAYAAVVYLRCISSEGEIRVGLVTSKTKVAPVKQISIPRLELCGAVLVTRLLLEVAAVFDIPKNCIHAWTDSQVVLAWLNDHPSRWSVFVANRVSEILTSLEPLNWSHVATKFNPADSASRGQSPSKLVDNLLWFNGPEFLRSENITYTKKFDKTIDIEAVRVHCSLIKNQEDSLIGKFSSLGKAVRVIARCKRFINNSMKRDVIYEDFLTANELSSSLKHIVRECQSKYFSDEIELIKRKEVLPKSSKLRSLNLFVDHEELLRVGGRLDFASVSFDRKHPLLIPKKSHLTDLIVADAHLKMLHGGPQTMINYIRSRFYIIGIKNIVKLFYSKCVICAKNKANSQVQLMGQLPAARVTPARAFMRSGVDYAGPIQIRTTKGRGHKSYKGYICLFVCMATRAIHLEAVSDLTSDGFLQAFKRFVARRGHCADMYSDNGTNFIGAANDLDRLFRLEHNKILPEVVESLANNNCTWHFIPPHAPNFGGLWEAGIKSTKYHLKRIIGNSTLTFEEISTVLCQVEACLNSRPLSVVTDSQEGNILTPGHFLVGEPLITPPDRDFESNNMSSLRRWQLTQRMLQDFWRQWSQEYLQRFLHRYRWSSSGPNPEIDDIVVIKEDGLPPCRWLYGRVIELHTGVDKIVRVVTLRTKNGTLKRPVSKLCFLPIAK